MKKFWKRQNRGRDRSTSLADEISNDLQRELLKQVALREQETSSPVVSTPKPEPVAQYEREPVAKRQSVAQSKPETSYEKSADDNVSVTDDVDTLDSSTIDSFTVSTRKPRIAKSLTSYKAKVIKAYSCFSGSVFTVASGMDSLLTSCSDKCCVQVNDDETTVYNSLAEEGTDSFTVDSSLIVG